MKRSERKVPYYRYDHIIRLMEKYPILQVAMLLICTAIGVFGFILPSIRDYVPIAREDALTYTGYFEAYDSKDAKIRFSDGARYSFDPHTVPEALEDALEATEKGTELSLAVNPRANVVIEVMRGTEELLNFETSQITIQKYHRGYIWIGALLTGCGIIFVVLLNLLIRAKKKEAERRDAHTAWQPKADSGKNSPALREADMTKRGRILLEVTKDKYEIVYRRKKSVNELIVNGTVYDEMKAVIEVEHTLSAVIDGHVIEAGLEDEVYSFIRFDEEILAEKRRVI